MENRAPGLLFYRYWPGLLGEMTALHGSYYGEHWGTDVSLETQVAAELAGFLDDFDPARDGLWAARLDGRLAGCVAIDGRTASRDDGVRLRWFIVRPGCQGQGVGGRLLDFALSFCRGCGYGRVHLWTFDGLEVARRLYRRAGFQLTQERRVRQWGREILEQRYVLTFASAMCRNCSAIL